MKLLLIGVIGKAHGLDGGCFVRPFNADSPLWTEGTQLTLVPADRVGSGQPDVIDVDGGRTLTIEALGLGVKDRLMALFREVPDRDAIERLRGAYVAVPLDAVAPAVDEDEFYFHEVKGWSVVDPAGASLGTVVQVVETYAELLEVRPEGGRGTVYVPIVASIVTAIDRAARRIVVDPPEGLFP